MVVVAPFIVAHVEVTELNRIIFPSFQLGNRAEIACFEWQEKTFGL